MGSAPGPVGCVQTSAPPRILSPRQSPMRRKMLHLPAGFGSAFATAFLAVNIVAAPAAAETPVLAILAAGGTTPTETAPAAPKLLVTGQPTTIVVGQPGQAATLVAEPALVQAPKEQPKAPVPAAAPEQPAVPPATQAAPSAPSVSPTLISDILGGAGAGATSSAAGGGSVNPASTSQGALSSGQQAATGTSASTVAGGEATVRASSDVGDLLSKSINALGVEVRHRSPIISDPIIRGYRVGQYVTVADGAFWFPARLDLDTIVSKIDSSQIENVVVIKGPYSVRYGPGFSFIDVETLSTPRYAGGQETHGSSGLNYKSNGQQWFGLQSIWGGNENSGYRVTYNIADGMDYWDGAGRQMPSGYNSQTYNIDYGFNVGRNGRFEFKAMHLEQKNVELPAADFDISYLSTDAYVARFFFDDKQKVKFGADCWYNYTNLYGDNFNPSKRAFQPILNNIDGLGGRDFGLTDSWLSSMGGRLYLTLGAADGVQVTVGADYRYIDTQTNVFSADSSVFGFALFANLPLPHSYSTDPGIFADLSVPLMDDRVNLKSGVRFDWVRTAVSDLEYPRGLATQPPGPPLTAPGSYFFPFYYGPGVSVTADQLQREMNLWSIFATAEWKVNDNVTLTAGFANAQRPPSLTELYALRERLAMLQSGEALQSGNPLLAPETSRQVDLGVNLRYDRFRAGANAFYAWVQNYITYASVGRLGIPVNFVPGAENNLPFYQFINTDLATLTGGEAYLEYDANRWLTFFGTLACVEGTDRTQNNRNFFNYNTFTLTPGFSQEALAMIPPLDARVGFRIRDPREGRWGAEFTTRMVPAQDKVALTLGQQATPGFTVMNVRSYWRANDTVLMLAGVENLGNKLYREFGDLRYPTSIGQFQPGFNAYVGMRLTY